MLERGILELLILHSGTYDITVTYLTSPPTVGTLQMQYTDDRCNITVTYIHPYVSVVCIYCVVCTTVWCVCTSCGWSLTS